MKNLTLMIAATLIASCATPAAQSQNDASLPKTKPAPDATPWDKWATSNPSWVEPAEPFRVIGNIYHVGTKGLGSYLIKTNEGHILIDGGMPQNAPLIKNNIATLGFDIKDVKILLNSHAHFDHSGGLADLKEASAARLIASEGDKSALEGGFYLGAEDDPHYSAPPVKVDQTISDGETVQLGGVTLTANIMPGHTRGCTTWTMTTIEQNTPYDVLMFCSASVAGNRLVGPPQYKGIVDDYRETFAKTKDMQPDVLLAFHPVFFDMWAKRDRQKAGDPLAFFDRETFPKLMQNLEAAFEKSLAAQTAQLKED